MRAFRYNPSERGSTTLPRRRRRLSGSPAGLNRTVIPTVPPIVHGTVNCRTAPSGSASHSRAAIRRSAAGLGSSLPRGARGPPPLSASPRSPSSCRRKMSRPLRHSVSILLECGAWERPLLSVAGSEAPSPELVPAGLRSGRGGGRSPVPQPPAGLRPRRAVPRRRPAAPTITLPKPDRMGRARSSGGATSVGRQGAGVLPSPQAFPGSVDRI